MQGLRNARRKARREAPAKPLARTGHVREHLIDGISIPSLRYNAMDLQTYRLVSDELGLKMIGASAVCEIFAL